MHRPAKICSGTREWSKRAASANFARREYPFAAPAAPPPATKGRPVRRLSTKTCPIFVLMTIAGVPSFQVKSVGCEATS